MTGEIVLMGDDRVAAVPVADCGEPLVDVSAALPVSETLAHRDPHRRSIRVGVLERLSRADAALPDGLRICWVEGHRSPQLQEHFFEAYRASLLQADPGLTVEDSHLLASRYVSPPHIAPHVCGAAVDVTLCTGTGEELDMGCAINASPEESEGACYFAADVAPQARRNRDVLAAALTGAGLVNYPTEWWHWSYGDRYWALLSGRPNALYGPVAGEHA